MPKTTAKKSVARQTERYRQAHLTELAAPKTTDAVRRAAQKRGSSAGLGAFAREFPVLTTLLSLAIVGAVVFTLYTNHLTPLFASPPDPCAWAKHSSGAATDPATVTRHYNSAPQLCIGKATQGNYQANIFMKNGSVIVIQLDQGTAPITVNNMVFLATHHFYDGLTFHRVVSNPMVAQTGDPRTIDPKADLTKGLSNSPSSADGPGYVIPDELPSTPKAYSAQAVAMANKGPGTGGSQFFICTGDDTSLPASYSYFGRVTDDTFKAALGVKQGDVISSITITYNPKGIPGINITPTPSK